METLGNGSRHSTGGGCEAGAGARPRGAAEPRDAGPGGAVSALRGRLGLKKFLHGSFVSPESPITGPEHPQSSRVSERYCLLLVLPF